MRIAVFMLLSAACAASALEQGRPYMMLVGDLVGAVEAPRLVQNVCVSRFPKRRMEFTDAYSAWRARHEELLKAIDEQVVRANARLERQGAPPGTSVVTTISDRLQRPFDALDAAKARRLCDSYPQILQSKDAEMSSSVPALLAAVREADAQANARE